MTFTKIIDVSAYQVNVPWKSLIDNAGLGCAIIKGDQLTATDNHVALARAAGVPVIGLYFWHDPTLSPSFQIQEFAKDVEKQKPDFIALDVEQYWAVWQDYWDYLAGRITQAQIRRVTPNNISANAKAVADGLHAKYPDLPMVIYSGTWFVLGYSQPLVDWIGTYDLWFAHYFDGALGTRTVTWDYLNGTPPQPFVVWMPNSSLKWLIWQYSSTMITPAINARYDWNVFAGSLEELKAWVKMTTPPTVPPSDIDEHLKLIDAQIADHETRIKKLEGGVLRLSTVLDYGYNLMKQFVDWIGSLGGSSGDE